MKFLSSVVHLCTKEGRNNGSLQNGASGDLGIWGGFVLSEVEGCYVDTKKLAP